MAKAKGKAKAVGSPAPRRSWFWMQGVVCGIGAAAAPGTAFMTAVLLAPGLAMYVTEQGQGRPIARAMLLMGAASIFMPLRGLWEQGGSFDTALAMLADPARPLVSWGVSGMGWLAGQLAEMLTRFILESHAAVALRGLNAERAALMAEWMDDGKA